jgi:P4 family phage/plasmid primase-like protien
MWQQDGLPIKDLAAVRDYSQVIILLDGDAKTNQQVYDAGLALREAFEAEGAAKVAFARMPAGDLDDWLSSREESDRGEMLGRLVRHAKSKPADRRPKGKSARPTEAELLPDPQDPMAVARVIEPDYLLDDKRTLVRWQDGWYRWDGPGWFEVQQDQIRAGLWTRTENAVFAAETPRGTEYLRWSPTKLKISNLTEALGAIMLLEHGIYPPAWLDDGDDPGTIVALKNGLLTVTDRELLAHDPAYFNLVSLPFDYDPDAGCDDWLGFLDSLWPKGGSGTVAALQEWFGYIVSGRADFHKILSITGPPRSGKGTIADTLSELIGLPNQVGPTMASFASSFGLQPLIGKSLAVIGDARLGPQNRDVVVERLLMISGQDTITIDRKYQQAWTGKMSVRMVILSNDPLRFTDISGTIASRFISLRTENSWLGREDRGLREHFRDTQLPGILNWALDGLARLIQQGRFTEPEGMADLLLEMRHAASPVAEFVDDECVVGPNYEVETERIWQTWNQWCLRQGRERTSTQAYLSRDLGAVVPGMRKVRGGSGKDRTARYIGLGLRDDYPDEPTSAPGGVIMPDPAGGPELNGGPIQDSNISDVLSMSDLSGSSHSVPSDGTLRHDDVPLVRVDVKNESGGVEEDDVSRKKVHVDVIMTYGDTPINSTEEGKPWPVKTPGDVSPPDSEDSLAPTVKSRSKPTTQPGRKDQTSISSAGPAMTSPATSVVVFDLETASSDQVYRHPEFIRLTGTKHNGQTSIEPGPVRFIGNHAGSTYTGHNIMAFDLPVLAQHAGLSFDTIHSLARAGRLFDTLIAARQDDPPMAREKGVDFTRRYDLDFLAEKFGLGQKSDALKKLAKLHGGFDKIPLDDPDYRRYLVQDLNLSDRLYGVLGKYAADPYVRREHEVAAIAARIRHNGFLVDTELLAQQVGEVKRRIELALAYLNQVHGVPLTDAKGKRALSPLTTKAGKAAIVKALTGLGVTRYWKTPKTGDIQLGKEPMLQLAAQYHHDRQIVRLCRAVAIVTSARAIYQTIQDQLCGDRVHPEISLRQSSGRWSYTGVNLAALGKRGDRYHERDVFLPEPGHLILAVDLSQVDMRAVAGLCGDPAYVELFRSSGDVHTQVAIQLFGSEKYRQTAKQIGHGWNYGEAPRTIAERYELSPSTVQAYDRGMRESYPKLVEWQTAARERAESGELLDNGWGRRMRPDPHRAWTQGPALEGQGAARDIMMHGLLRLPDEILPLLRAQVHDEIVLSVPESDYQDVKQVVLDALQYDWDGPGGLSVPIEADVSPSGRCWGEVYAKE